MNIAFETTGGSAERPNEDWVTATPTAVVVLDGVTARGVDAGCRHGVSWFVGQLGKQLLISLDTDASISDALAEAIGSVGDLHADTCDLKAPGSPAAAVAVLRRRGQDVEYLVLADSTIVLDTVDGIREISDRRVDDAVPDLVAETRRAVIGSPEHRAAVSLMSRRQLEMRNIEGGYWVATSDPAAAKYAFTGSVPAVEVTRAAVLTDGASRAVDTFHGMDWPECLDFLQDHGPRGLIAYVRGVEASDPEGRKWPRFKRSDDATVALVRM